MSMLINNNNNNNKNIRSLNLKSRPELDFIEVNHKELTENAREKITIQILNWLNKNKQGLN